MAERRHRRDLQLPKRVETFVASDRLDSERAQIFGQQHG